MSFIYNMADTWNAGGTTFNGIYMNISNGAGGAPVGAAASRVIRIDSNGTAIFAVDINGAIYANNFLDLYVGGTRIVDISSSAFTISTNSAVNLFIANLSPLTFGPDGTTQDTFLRRGNAANILDQRNGVNAQASYVYNTFTSSTDYEAFKIDWITTAGICRVGPAVGASGTLRPMMATFNLITVASLPAPATANRGAHMFVSDANLPIIFTTVSAGGAVVIPVFSNGANWICG